MKNNLDFIGIIQRESVRKTETETPWKPIFFELPPYEVITLSSNYLLTLGSANISSPTVSYGFQYVSGLDVFRHDFTSSNPYEPVVNIDHYIAGAIDPVRFAVFMTPPQSYHWPKTSDKILTYTPPPWRETLKDMLHKGRH